jgi:hypothetical protein
MVDHGALFALAGGVESSDQIVRMLRLCDGGFFFETKPIPALLFCWA